MATLQSPGVQVQVIDESFYTPAAPGTVPLIFVASATDKPNASGTGTAPGTLAANAGKVWTITSQRDLTDTFGVPRFITDAENNPVHGGEQNEYGLQAAYSLLGVSSKAYVVRADLDLGQLTALGSIPEGLPVSGTYWVDSNDSTYGVKEFDAVNKVYVVKTPLIIDNDNKEVEADFDDMEYVWVPKQSFGTIGSYAMVVTSENSNQLWFKNTDNNWVVVGTAVETGFDGSSTWMSTCWQTSWPVAKSTGLGTVAASSTISINAQTITFSGDTSVGGIADSINGVMYNKGVGAKVVGGKLYLYADKTAMSDGVTDDGRIALADGTATVSSLGLSTVAYNEVAIQISPHTQHPSYALNKNPTGSVWIQTTTPNSGAHWHVKLYNGATQSWSTVAAPLYGNPSAATFHLDKTGGKLIPVGTLYIDTDYERGAYPYTPTRETDATFKLFRRNSTSPTKITGSANLSSFQISTPASTATTVYSFAMSETLAGEAFAYNTATITVATVASNTVTTVTTCTGTDIVTAISAAGFEHISAKLNTDGTLSISHALGGEIYIWDNGDAMVMPELGFTGYDMSTKTGTANLYDGGQYNYYDYVATNWKPLVYQAKQTAPYTTPDDGRLWYSSIADEVDIMIHNGTTWVGYQTYLPNTDPAGPYVGALAPTAQSDGTDLVDGDIWISTAAGADGYGKDVYVYNGTTLKWVKQDLTDQTTPNGWLFADARWSVNGYDVEPAKIVDMLMSDFLDPDAPDPTLYPQGMRLWNLRRSGFNVKKYVQNYINIYDNEGRNPRYDEPMDGSESTIPYFADRWVTASPNNEDGSGAFGRFAQRKFVVKGLKELIDTNITIRDKDTLVFNLIACPGYPEAIQNMIAFNTDRGLTAFVVGDTPFRLKPTGTDLANWGNNTALAFDNGEQGGVSHDEYMAMFYPSGYTNDNTGNYIVVPPSHMMLRTILNSDAKSYQWFAPAGTRRGGVDNATSVGYITSEGEFKTVALYEGLRDVLAGVKINSIATFPGAGIVNFAQYTRARNASALDRINVARLICYLRRQLDILARPFLFEPNDRITRNEIKAAAESLMLELVSQRALYDFIVVCDDSNNTPSRIDRSELWLDIAIEPVKAVEFIYIPLRIKNTGAIKAGR